MELLQVKTARFSDVVKNCGEPEVYLPLFEPKNDKEFQAHLRATRVMTVHQETVGNKTDYGEVGYTGDRRGTILIFPKSLKEYQGKRIVGIRYDTLVEPAAAPPPRRPAAPPPKLTVVKKAVEPAPAKEVQTPPEHAKEKARTPEATALTAKIKRLESAVADALKALDDDRPMAAYKILRKISG